MDGQQFDTLIRHLTQQLSRRQMLRALAGSAAGGMLALIGVRVAAAGPVAACRVSCPDDEACVDGACCPAVLACGNVCCPADSVCLCQSPPNGFDPPADPADLCICACPSPLVEENRTGACVCPDAQSCGELCCESDQQCCRGGVCCDKELGCCGGGCCELGGESKVPPGFVPAPAQCIDGTCPDGEHCCPDESCSVHGACLVVPSG